MKLISRKNLHECSKYKVSLHAQFMFFVFIIKFHFCIGIFFSSSFWRHQQTSRWVLFLFEASSITGRGDKTSEGRRHFFFILINFLFRVFWQNFLASKIQSFFLCVWPLLDHHKDVAGCKNVLCVCTICKKGEKNTFLK